MQNQKDILEQIRVKKLETLSSDFLTEMAKEIHRTELKKVVPIYRKPLFYMLTSAAACAIFIIVSVLTSEQKQEISLTAEFQEISSAELLAYVDANLEDFEEELLGEFVENLDLNETYSAPETTAPIAESQVSTPILDEIQKEDILDYLQDEGYDVYDDDLNDFI